jgi:GT2 family glycosyltransferase
LVIEFRSGIAHVVITKSLWFMTLIAVSILNFKSFGHTIACVESVLGASRAAGELCTVEIFVADNSSIDDEHGQLQLAFSNLTNVHLQINAVNLGFSAGHNRNLTTIFECQKPDYVWLLNNDCLVNENALAALLGSAQRLSEVGIWGATLLEQDGETIQCAGGCFYNSWLSNYRQYGHGKRRSQLTQLKQVDYDYIAGASLFLPVATLHKGLSPPPGQQAVADVVQNKWLNEAFFLYFEELDLAKRLRPELKMNGVPRHT